MWEIKDSFNYTIATVEYSTPDIVAIFNEGIEYYDAKTCRLVPTGLDAY